MDHFSKGTEKKREKEAGEGGAGEKTGERKERERVQGGGEMKGYYFFCICHFPAISHMTS